MERKKAAAIGYDALKNDAPKIVAKGEYHMANKIIQIAQKNNIPIKEDKDLIEVLSKIEIDQEIPPELYKAVAEILSFIYTLSKENNEKKDK